MAEAMDDMPIAFADLETTGLDPERDRIVEVGVYHGFHMDSRPVVFDWIPACAGMTNRARHTDPGPSYR